MRLNVEMMHIPSDWRLCNRVTILLSWGLYWASDRIGNTTTTLATEKEHSKQVDKCKIDVLAVQETKILGSEIFYSQTQKQKKFGTRECSITFAVQNNLICNITYSTPINERIGGLLMKSKVLRVNDPTEGWLSKRVNSTVTLSQHLIHRLRRTWRCQACQFVSFTGGFTKEQELP